MAQELLARILHSLRPHNAGIYEKLAAQTAKRVRELALEVLNTFVTFGVAEDDFSDLDCFRQELDATLHNLVQKAITVAWIAHEASYSESARESVRSEALPGPTGAFGTSDGDPGTGARTLPRVFQTSADCCRDRDEREETSPAPAVSQPPVVPREPRNHGTRFATHPIVTRMLASATRSSLSRFGITFWRSSPIRASRRRPRGGLALQVASRPPRITHRRAPAPRWHVRVRYESDR